MPLNKNAAIRYRIIDNCLRNRARKWTWKDILDEVNKGLAKEEISPIGKTTLFEDLKDIEYRVYQSDIEKTYGHHKKIVYYRYANPDHSINKQPLTEQEAIQIRSAIQIIARFKGMPQFEWVNEWVPVLESRLNIQEAGHNIISFQNNEFYRGKEHIGALFNAILYKRTMKITYQDFNAEFPYEFIYHPYHLKQYNGRWFAFGHNPTFEQPIQNLALDRVINLEEMPDPYHFMEIDWEDYFADIVGVTKKNEAPVDVKILILDELQASYIKTKPLHATQKPIRKTERGLETSIRVIPNMELYMLILSFGPRIRILSPAGLVDKIKDSIDEYRRIYQI